MPGAAPAERVEWQCEIERIRDREIEIERERIKEGKKKEKKKEYVVQYIRKSSGQSPEKLLSDGTCSDGRSGSRPFYSATKG